MPDLGQNGDKKVVYRNEQKPNDLSQVRHF
jgi:hypothetical protein